MKALEGVKILDFTHVQSGPTCTQLLAWFGADVIKIERPGEGDITRGQLRDIPGVDSLYFTMLNHNKRSITIDGKNPEGKKILEGLVKACDVMVENFAPARSTAWASHGRASRSSTRRSSLPRSRASVRDHTRIARSTRTSPNAPAVRHRPPDSGMGRRSSPAPRSAIPGPGCISRLASSRRCFSAPRAAAANG